MVCSPLMRALETAAAVFGTHTEPASQILGALKTDESADGAIAATQSAAPEAATQHGADVQSYSQTCLMVASQRKPRRRKRHPRIGSGSVPIVAHDLCRESFGVRTCLLGDCHVSADIQRLSCLPLLLLGIPLQAHK